MYIYINKTKPNIMRDFNKTLEKFLNELKKYNGSNPKFSIDFQKEEISIFDAPSGFLKILYSEDKAVCHFHEGKITVKYFV